jgi:hypothetical protein
MVSGRAEALEILGLPAGASDDDVRAAYKRLSIKWCGPGWGGVFNGGASAQARTTSLQLLQPSHALKSLAHPAAESRQPIRHLHQKPHAPARHPDKNDGSSASHVKMQQINAAREHIKKAGTGRAQRGGEDDEDEEGSDWYTDDEDEDAWGEGEADFGPFGFGNMNFEGFVEMWRRYMARQQAGGGGQGGCWDSNAEAVSCCIRGANSTMHATALHRHASSSSS